MVSCVLMATTVQLVIITYLADNSKVLLCVTEPHGKSLISQVDDIFL